MPAHRVLHDMYRAGHLLADPGASGAIRATQDLQLCEMVSLGVETRTLTTPTKAGIRFVLRLKTDGGTVTVTAAGGLNSSLETEATFADQDDFLSLISVSTATGFRWEILEGNVGTVLSSNTPSHTPSHTVSNTPSRTPSHTASHTPSHTPSHTVSHTPSHTASHTPS